VIEVAQLEVASGTIAVEGSTFRAVKRVKICLEVVIIKYLKLCNLISIKSKVAFGQIKVGESFTTVLFVSTSSELGSNSTVFFNFF